MDEEGIHIGLIPDGNRRYATKNKLPPWEGHDAGAKKLREFAEWCAQQPEVKRVSVYALSTENLNRSPEEVRALWYLFKRELSSLAKDPIIEKNSVQIRILGDSRHWSPEVTDVVRNVIDSTKHYSRMIMNILLAYGSRFEIAEAVSKVAGKPIEVLDKFLLEREPLNLVIRTGGQKRLSNFMLYQASYANIYFENKLWPEVTKKDFRKWLNWHKAQVNKYGK